MNLDILKNGNAAWMFKSKHYTNAPDYRHVICRAISCLMDNAKKKEDKVKEKEAIKKKLEEMKNFSGDSSPIISGNFFDMYAINEKSKPVFIVDQTGGCFPLVCYQESKNENAPKYKAFKKALEDISDKFEKIYEIIDKKTIWNKELKSELEKQYKYIERV